MVGSDISSCSFRRRPRDSLKEHKIVSLHSEDGHRQIGHRLITTFVCPSNACPGKSIPVPILFSYLLAFSELWAKLYSREHTFNYLTIIDCGRKSFLDFDVYDAQLACRRGVAMSPELQLKADTRYVSTRSLCFSACLFTWSFFVKPMANG